MSDNLRPEDRRKTMRAVKGKRTSIERKVFAMLAGMGISGWRTNASDIIGKPDVVFESAKLAIFVDGCFWHGCPVCNKKLPKSNRDYWQRKISRNKELASQYNQALQDSGWNVLRIWEHELKHSEEVSRIRSQIHQKLNQSKCGDE
jgi:DNA mismatch endonuclease (patch repair protein)